MPQKHDRSKVSNFFCQLGSSTRFGILFSFSEKIQIYIPLHCMQCFLQLLGILALGAFMPEQTGKSAIFPLFFHNPCLRNERHLHSYPRYYAIRTWYYYIHIQQIPACAIHPLSYSPLIPAFFYSPTHFLIPNVTLSHVLENARYQWGCHSSLWLAKCWNWTKRLGTIPRLRMYQLSIAGEFFQQPTTIW